MTTATPTDPYLEVPEAVRDRVESAVALELHKWYLGLNKTAMRSGYTRRTQTRAEAPVISSLVFKILAEEAKKEVEAEEAASAAKMKSSGAGKPMPEPEEEPSGMKSASEELMDTLSKAAAGMPMSTPEPETAKEYDGGSKGGGSSESLSKTTRKGTAVLKERSIGTLETSGNQICACPKCIAKK